MKKKACLYFMFSLFISNNYSYASPYYIGLGLTANIPDNTEEYNIATGYQIYGGYDLGIKLFNRVGVSIEAGYQESGDYLGKAAIDGSVIIIPSTYNSSGFWTTAVFDFSIFDKFGIHGSTGYDASDENFIMGAGVSYYFSRYKLNLDYLLKDTSDSAQINISYRF